jgi:hypothetical protein
MIFENGVYTNISTPNYALVRLVPDVSSDDPMYIECDHRHKAGFSRMSIRGNGCEIHIRDINSINTGGWDRGKFGRGMTTRIQ